MTKLNLTQRIEATILSNLIHNEEYTRKVIPFLKVEYFNDYTESVIFKTVNEYIEKYNNSPTIQSLTIDIQKAILNEDQYKAVQEYLVALSVESSHDFQWLVDQTEKFCKDKAIYNAILEGIHIIDGKSKDQTPEALPAILTEALSVSFDTHIGHDYMEQYEERYDYYHEKEEKIPFDLEFFNRITKGGLPNKTLNVCLAGTGVGKSLFMCHVSSGALSQGNNVLYITLEMSEERIAERIDANLLNIRLDDLVSLPKKMYEKKMEELKSKVKGRLIIKEYPTAAASTNHFRSLLNELNLKRNFKPNIIFVDYINICSSARIRPGQYVNSYSYVKSIAEELRGLAVEFDVPIMSATQTNRQGFQNTEIGRAHV